MFLSGTSFNDINFWVGVFTILATLGGAFVYFENRKKERLSVEQNIHVTRPELEISNYKFLTFFSLPDSSIPCDLEVFVAPIEKVDVSDDDARVHYCKELSNIDQWSCAIYQLTNKGKTDICYLNVVSSDKRNTCIFPTSFIFNELSLKLLNYSVHFDNKKIRVGETFNLYVFYHRTHVVRNSIFSSLLLVFRDDNGRLWEQSLWAPDNKIYESTSISSKEYKSLLSINEAIDCFQHPWLW